MFVQPDLVDVDQIAARLATDRPTLQKLRRLRGFPEPDLLFQRHPIWHWDRIAHWARQSGRSLRRPYPHATPKVELLDINAVAAKITVTPKVAQHWQRTGKLVAPNYRWTHADAWLWEFVQEWIAARHRSASQTPLWSRLFEGVAETRAILAADPIAERDRLHTLLGELAHDEQRLLAQAVPVKPVVRDGTRFRDLDRHLDQLDELRQRMDELADFLDVIQG